LLVISTDPVCIFYADIPISLLINKSHLFVNTPYSYPILIQVSAYVCLSLTSCHF